MDYACQIFQEQLLVRLSGRLTFNNHADFRGMVREIQESAAPQVTIDLSGLTFIDSAGLGMLLIAREELLDADRSLTLRGAEGQVKRVFEVARLSQIVQFEG